MNCIISLLTCATFSAFLASASATVVMDYVRVGNPNNVADTTGYGAVDHSYWIGKYEVTNAQYAEFLNAKGQSNTNEIYNSSMASYGITQSGSSGSYTYSVTSGFENKPVIYVSWFDAARFANWMSNGQGNGDMEIGAYTLNGATSGIITVNSGAQVYLPSENEWYKAAYYNLANASYSLYPNGQNTITNADANYGGDAYTLVGSYNDDPSSYGTFDQGGNVWEFNDAVIGSLRSIRGGACDGFDFDLRSSSLASPASPQYEGPTVGFRLAAASIDTDSDGLDDLAETNTGIYVSPIDTGTNPNSADSDGDGVPDGLEVKEKTSPVDATKFNSFSKGLVAYYPLDKSGADETGSGYNGNFSNSSLESVDGIKTLKAIGSSPSGILIPNGGQLALPATGWAISGWIKCNDFSAAPSPNGYFTLYESGDIGGSQQSAVNLSYSAHGLNFQITGFDDYPINAAYLHQKFYKTSDFTSDTLRAGQWHHIMVVVSGSDISAFVDGSQLIGSTRGGSTWSGEAPKLTTRAAGIGLPGQGGSIPNNSYIKDVRIYGRSLGISEVAALSARERPQFQIIKGSYTWQQAKGDAEARGGRLAVLDTQAKIDHSVFLTNNPILQGSYHIGLQDPSLTGQWKWINGSNLSASNWASGEPQNYQGRGETVAAMIPTYGGSWADIRNDDIYDGYILEYITTNLVISSPDNGSISGAGTYDIGATATLTATPNPGYLFTGWTGDASGTENPLTITMDADKTVGATFVEDTRDPDSDGLTNYQEIITHGSNPDLADTDGDGIPDGLEVKEMTNPMDATKFNSFSKGLVAYYPFDENAMDATGKGNLGTEGNVTYISDRFIGLGGAAKFSATSSIEVPSLVNLSFRPTTYSMWIKFDQMPPSGGATTLIGRMQVRNQEDGALMIFNTLGYSNELCYYTGGDIIGSGFRPQVNQWYNIAFVYTSEGMASFYVDGILASSIPFIAPQSLGLPFRIGASSILDGVDGNDTHSVEGSIDDVRIYNRALAPTEVATLYSSERPHFQIIQGSYTWQQAKADAEARGGRLAVLNTQAKIDEMNGFLVSQGSWPFMWIGLTDESTEGRWRWIDGVDLTAANWQPTQPSGLDPAGSEEDYVHILPSPGADEGMWNDLPNTGGYNSPIGYLLEYPDSKNLIARQASNGTITGAGEYDPGTSATLTAIPDAGYTFTGWTGDASGTTNPLSILMDADKTVGATFVEDTSDSDSDGLTNYQELVVYLTDPNKADTDGDAVNDGQEVSDTTDPLVADSDADGLTDGEEKTLTTNPLLADTDGDSYSDGYEVQFSTDPKLSSSVPKFILTLSNNGTVVGGSFAMSGNLAHGTNATITATAQSGYLFGSWTGDASGSSNPTNVLMNSNKTVGASFVEDSSDSDTDGLTNYQELVVYLTDPSKADTDGDGVNDGQEVTDTTNPLVADSDADGLTDGEEKTLTTNPLLADTDGDSYSDGYEVQFSTDPKLSSSVPKFILTLSNNGTVVGGSFAMSGNLAHGTNATITATAQSGYLFGSWTGDASGTTNPTTVLMNSNKTVGATFVEDSSDLDSDGLTNYQELVVYLTNPSQADTDGDGVNDGQEVNNTTNPLVADSDADGLTDGEEKTRGTNPLLTDTDGDSYSDGYEVQFSTDPKLSSSVPKFVLTLSNSGSVVGGSFVLSGTLAHGTNATITATPQSGYLFSSWTGDASGTTNPLTLLMDADKTVGATFIEDSSDLDTDGLTNYQELVVYLTDPSKADTDDDGVNDGQEVTDTTDALVADSDADALTDGEEKTLTTNPLLADTDGDSYSDGYEVQFSTDPKLSSSVPKFILTLSNDGTVVGGSFAMSGNLAHGTNATVTATPQSGYLFSSWTGDASGSSNPTNVLMNSNKTVGASFVEDTSDLDADALTNYQELVVYLTDPSKADTDSDGVNDGQEVADATNPLVADTDADGLSDGEEKVRGTNPGLADTDGDGLSDGDEVFVTLSNPLSPDSDNNGISDSFEDPDNDGIANGIEIRKGSNPKKLDSDNDGLSDTYELIYKGGTDAFTPRIGDRIRLELRELGFQGTYKLVGKLPTGLTFNSLTGVIDGKLTGKPLTSSLTVQVLNGKTVVRSIPLVLPVKAFPVALTGTWQALIYDLQGVPQGLLTTTFTAPGLCSASLELSGPDKARSGRTSFELSPGENKATFNITFPATTTLRALEITLELDGDKAELGGSCSIGELNGFRLARGTELPTLTRAYTMLIDHGTHDGFQVPAGMGWATGSLSNRGSITLTGQLGDAKSVTGTLSLGATGQAILWLKPYLNKSSKIGGVLSFNDTGVIPSTSLTKNDSHLSWHRVADANELSYPGGFAALPAEVLIKAYTVPSSAPVLAQNLGLIGQTFPKIEFDGAGLAELDNTFALPSTFVMDAAYKLVAQPVPGRVMAPWVGAINTKVGSFSGTLSVNSPVSDILLGSLSASGVIFPADERTSAVGAGLIKIPFSGKAGAFRTGALILER